MTKTIDETLVPADWMPLHQPGTVGGARPFIRALEAGEICAVRYYCRKGDHTLFGLIRFGPQAEGPPDHAHGGSIAAMFDEIMGASAWFAGHAVLAARVSVSFTAPLPLKETLLFEAPIHRVEGRKIFTGAAIRNSEGSLFAKADGLFIRVSPEMFGDHADRVKEIMKAAGIDPSGRT